ncbi:MAG: PilZ domain-containing protein [Acidobacteriota bacterium]
MSPESKDRRKHNRVAKSLRLKPAEGRNGFMELQCTNISLGGACCISKVNFPVMTKLLMHLYLHETDGHKLSADVPLSIHAYVVRSEKIKKGKNKNRYLLALFFKEMENAQAHLLREFIEKAAQRGAAKGKKVVLC